MRRYTTRTTALPGLLPGAVAALLAGMAVVLAAPPASADTLSFTVTREGHTVRLYRVVTARTPVTGRGATRSDFDGDGVDDLAVTASVDGGSRFPGSDRDVVITYSSAAATDYLSPQFGNGCFGDALAAGNFDGDAYHDLVVGAPCEPGSATDLTESGGVWVIPGSRDGLQLARTVHVDQDSPGVPDGSERDDAFGFDLAAGDLTGDGLDELAVGAPSEDLAGARDAGAVTLLRGSRTGLTASGAAFLHQDLAWVPGTAEAGDAFGAGLAIGRVDPGNADLVVGVPGERLLAEPADGLVTLLRGGPAGVAASGASSVSQAAVRAKYGGTTFFNGFGATVAVGDTTGDGLGEVVLGAAGTNVSTPTRTLLATGAVVVLAGRAGGLSAQGVRVIHQDSPGVPGVRENQDEFGRSVDVGDVTGDGRADVLVGMPGEALNGLREAGAVVLLRGAAAGVGGAGAQSWSQDSPGVPGAVGVGHRFGNDVSLLGLDGRAGLDAAVAAPFDRAPGDPAHVVAGSVTTFAGRSAGLAPQARRTGADLRAADFTMPYSVQYYGQVVVGRSADR